MSHGRSQLAQRHEEGLARFLIASRRARFRRALAGGGPARIKELDRLAHSTGLDERWMGPVGGGPTTVEALAAWVGRAAPGADELYIVSGWTEIDGMWMGPVDAIDAAARADSGTLLSALPGEVALFMGELVDDARVLLRGR